jgi:hypothetical protein
VEGRLSEAAQALLHGAETADDSGDDASLLSQARACADRLAEDLRKREVDELRARVRAAERDGRVGDALQLLAELSKMERDLRDLRDEEQERKNAARAR